MFDLLTVMIATLVGAAAWQLVIHTVALVRGHHLNRRDSQVLQTVLGMVMTFLIVMEFKHSLLVVDQPDIVQVRSVLLIALLALLSLRPNLPWSSP